MRERAPHDEGVPRRFGRYLLFDRIGRGGMADIYLARASTELGAARRVVVKQISKPLSGDPSFARMLVEEAKLVAGLRHANIAQVLDLGREGDRLFIAMEYVEGFDLNQLLRLLSKRKVALPAELPLLVVREVLAALDFAHRAKDGAGRPLGIVHRDVSPSNVLVSFEGEVKLCDFGIAKALGAPTPATSSHASEPRISADGLERSRIAGKAAYMSPEHARGEDIDARADVFAVGIVLWELCAGRRLYRGSEEEMLALAREAVVPPLPDRGLPLHAELAAILERALARDRSERFGSAAEMARALEDYAMRAKLFASPLRFGAFLSEHFELDVVRVRRARERAAEALERGPAATLVPIDPPALVPSEPPGEGNSEARDHAPPAALAPGAESEARGHAPGALAASESSSTADSEACADRSPTALVAGGSSSADSEAPGRLTDPASNTAREANSETRERGPAVARGASEASRERAPVAGADEGRDASESAEARPASQAPWWIAGAIGALAALAAAWILLAG